MGLSFSVLPLGSWLGYVSYDEYLRVDTLERERLTDNAAVIHDHISHQLISIGTTLSVVSDVQFRRMVAAARWHVCCP